MTRLKHVSILIILILPMFALVPIVVTGPTGVQTNAAAFDTSVPATSVPRTHRVAVYAEDNTTLPSYATGGVYTNHYSNVISLLESAGYAVTALSTQDILDHELKVANFDVFVLPNNGPKDEIVTLVMDYWRGGGGVLNFDNSVGFCFYGGIIDPVFEGSDQGGISWDVLPSDLWPNMTISTRNPVTKAYDVGDWYLQSGVLTVFNPALIATIGPRYIPFAVTNHTLDSYIIFGLDDSDRGGRLVHFPGNCSDIPTWQNQMIIDAIDWLTPRPKGRILFDLSHFAAYGVDLWDPNEWSGELYYTWRDALVSRGYTFDKLHPSSAGNLTSDNLAGYDMLVIPMSAYNYTSSEVSAVTSWVSNGGGLLVFGDQSYDLGDKQEQNKLLGAFDLWNNYTVGLANTVDSSEFHPIVEGCLSLTFVGPGALNYSGAAYPIWYDTNGRTAVAGQEYGDGRVILTGDLDFLGHNQIGNAQNLQFGINLANWLSAATADVLLHVDNLGISSPWVAPAVDALNDLGIEYYLTFSESYMNLSLHDQQWSLVILDSCWPGIGLYLDEVSSYLDGGGDLIVSWHQVDTFDGDPLFAKIGFDFADDLPDKVPFYIWETDHGVFNYPNDYGALNFTSVDDYGDEGDLLTVYSNATALGGYTDTNLPGNATTVLGFNDQVIWNSYLIDQLTGDYDDSTYSDSFELWQNEIAFLYFDRPIIDHPADVTYMETETGNEIVWTPTADAGPWTYTLWINGSTHGPVHWIGAPITINVDGVNASITSYELLIVDRLGYTAFDEVTLNVTEYIAPPGPGGLDPTLLLIIGAAVAGVIIILVVVMKRKKK
ncbi:MAG: DUF4350 domain-containing protein [Candidatus Thorarchaeota archaeon]